MRRASHRGPRRDEFVIHQLGDRARAGRRPSTSSSTGSFTVLRKRQHLSPRRRSATSRAAAAAPQRGKRRVGALEDDATPARIVASDPGAGAGDFLDRQLWKDFCPVERS